MIGTDDEQHYWDSHEAASEIERLRLTDAERVALYWALATLETEPDARNAEAAATLRGLLDRIETGGR
jgi:hypothetical protein